MDTMLMAGSLDEAAFPEAYWDNPVHCLSRSSSPDFAIGQAAAHGHDLGMDEEANQGPCLQRLYLVFQDEGRGRLVLETWDTSLEAGDLALYVDESPALPVKGRGRQVRMNFPLDGLEGAPLNVISRLPLVLSGKRPSTALLSRMADNLNEARGEISPALASLFIGHLLSLLGETLALEGHGVAIELPRLTRFHLHRIKSWLRLHLREPDLAVKDVARALGMSPSHVHRLFAHEALTVTDWLWRQRLEGAAADLALFSEAHRTVGEIALGWGFNNLSHFSRTFKKRYGMAPKVWRAQAPWRKPLMGVKGET